MRGGFIFSNQIQAVPQCEAKALSEVKVTLVPRDSTLDFQSCPEYHGEPLHVIQQCPIVKLP
jgi:hypothetical protein